MNNDRNTSRVYVSIDHALIIQNVTSSDSSFYFCQPYQAQDVEKDLNFYIDVVDVNKTTIESGNITEWAKYQKENFYPINQLFLHGNGPDFVRLRDALRINLVLITTWDAWSDCEVCGRPLGEGIRKKKGHCRIKITPLHLDNTTNVNSSYTEEELQLIESTEIGCRSKILSDLTPTVFNLTKVVPDFVQTDSCTGTCNPDAAGKYRGWKSTKKTGFKYRKTIVLTENSHLTLVCPESTLENVVVWKRNGRNLAAGESVEPPKPNMEPKITVDTFNTLYLHEVTKNEEGNYTCLVDDIRMQQTIIYVVSKSRLLTQGCYEINLFITSVKKKKLMLILALLRHMMYLGFILSLTLSCYVAGLIITWTRRRKFKSYEAIRKRRKKLLLTSSSSENDEDDDDDDDVEKATTKKDKVNEHKSLLKSKKKKKTVV
ncbi:hypothetical protein MML48_4g00008454 [Holotrichia oblita]|uniref:Uncharacterized protein n=1 Tax=Holotrichia oblita TaxID=644536 RepID=A0ACB9T6T3_HOLOL|nr:hypothetical protein MML48_4g00008454 [Holotrichia oblita]